MKKYIALLIIVFIGVGTYVLLKRPQPAPMEASNSNTAPTSTISPAVQSAVTEPFVAERLRIPRIKVDADIEFVGLDQEKRMDVPKDDMNVAWYKYGAAPGDKGSAVFAGHFDTKTGGQAVFYRLSELKKGDLIIVQGESGEERQFIVTDTQIFKDESFPISLVFSQNDKRRLNLITCDGVFDQTSKNYSDRLVVFSEMKN